MPLYSYECTSCEHQFEAYNSIDDRKSHGCTECGKHANLILSRKPPAVHGFALGWFEHIAEEPIYIKNKKHLKEVCNQHDCYAPGVLS